MGAGWGTGLSPAGSWGMVSAARLAVAGWVPRQCQCPGEQARLSPSSQQMTSRAWLVLCSITRSSAAWITQARGFISSAQAVGVSGGEVRSDEVSAALKFTTKYLIREMFDFNNKWAWISRDMSTGKVHLQQSLYNGGIFWPALLRFSRKWKNHVCSCSG